MPVEDIYQNMSLSSLNTIIQNALPSIKIYIRHVETQMIINYQKLSFFEYGFDVCSIGNTSIFDRTSIKCVEYTANGFRFKLMDKSNPSKVFAINNRGEINTRFGYNGSGDFLVANHVDGLNIRMNDRNIVVLYALDFTGLTHRKYWLYVEDGKLNGSLNEERKGIFELFFADLGL